MNNLTELKTSELEGAALDWAVGRAAGVDFGPDAIQSPREVIIGGYQGRPRVHWSPRQYWAQLGPLITKYLIDFCVEHPETIGAALCDENGMYIDDRMTFGKTHLIAACRAIAANHFGDTVGIPTYLLEA